MKNSPGSDRALEQVKAEIPIAKSADRIALPRLAFTRDRRTGGNRRYLLAMVLPGEFPYLNGAYREMYLEPCAR